jgi:VWFA-related protein
MKIVLAVMCAALAAQQPTFKSATSLVEVDIIARDKDGRFVSGLTADDFEVLEEGKPQAVQHFYLVTERANITVEPLSNVVLPRSPDRTDRRILVFFFDSEHLSAQALLKLKRSAMDFVNDQLRPSDVAGVYLNGTLVNGHLTNQKQELLDAIRGAEPAFETSETRARALIEFPRVDSFQEASQIDGGDRSALTDAGTRECGGEQARLCTAEGGREFVEDKIERKAHLFIDQSRRAALATMRSIGYVVKNLSGLEGRKTMVLLSEGFLADDARSTLPVLAGQAARAGVTIYAIDARGTAARSGVSAAADPSVQGTGLSGLGDTSDEPLDILAAETGGMTLRHRDDFAKALADVATDTGTYYVLAYSPENGVLDGKYRHITLKTKWAGLDVRARRGYVATPLPATRQLRITK